MEELESIERESNVLEKLKNLYKSKVKNIERKYNLYNFSLPRGGEIQDAEFGSLPMVLLIGQYSTGKTTFIRHLLRTDFPGMHIGPEPTSDKFMAMLYCSDDDKEVEDVGSSGAALNEDETNVPDDSHGKENVEKSDYIMSDDEKTQNGKLIQGNTLTVMPDLPFSSLSSFGDKFLNHFQGSECSASILREMIFIDTPGVLSGEKQRISRSYDFGKAVKWFADRSDLILLLFDSHKLDISDELKEVISTIMPHNDDKIRCILNKADKEKKDQFVRVYGSLTWSIGKILQTPEVVRIFTGSYWDKPFENKDFAEMFHADEKLLISELKTLPSMRTQRLVNELVKRIRLVKVYICLLANIRSRMPRLFGHKAAQEKILQDLRPIFEEVQRKYNLSVGDMPDDLSKFQESLCSAYASFSNIPDLDKEALQTLDDLLEKEIPQLMKDYTASKSRSNSRHNKTTTKIDIPITSLKRGADEMMNKQQNNVGRGTKVRKVNDNDDDDKKKSKEMSLSLTTNNDTLQSSKLQQVISEEKEKKVLVTERLE